MPGNEKKKFEPPIFSLSTSPSSTRLIFTSPALFCQVNEKNEGMVSFIVIDEMRCDEMRKRRLKISFNDRLD